MRSLRREEPLQDEEEEVSLKSRHGCTDVPCCLLFVVALGAYFALYAYVSRVGHLGRLFHGINYEGQVCGVDHAVADKPFLYWCPSSMSGSSMTLNTGKPICVESCPGAATAGPASAPVYNIQPECEVVSGPEGMSSYRTIAKASYCIPRGGAKKFKALAKNTVKGASGGHGKAILRKFMEALASIPDAWPVLLAVFLCSIVLGYLYLALLRHCAEPLIYLSMVVGVVGFAALGCQVWSTAAGIEPTTFPEDEDTSNEVLVMRILAGVCWFLAAAIVFLFCCFRHSIAVASACAEVACEAMFEMPSLLIAPLVKAAIKGALFFVLLYGFLLLYSTADVTAKGENGLSRSFELTPKHYYSILFQLLMSFWILAFVSAVYEFVIAYAVAEFYYTPYDHDDEKDVNGCCAMCEGLHLGLMYHSGSLAFGSLLIALLQTLQKVIEYAEQKNEETANSHVIKCLLCCCAACVNCCKDIVKAINKNAYIDIAITSRNFCDAAKQAIEMIVELGGAMGLLNGATYVFTVFGAVAISLACGALARTAILHGALTDAEGGVEHPLAPVIVSMILGLIVALDFMAVFDMTSDTLLYCYGTDIRAGKSGFTAPAALKELVHSSGGGKGEGGGYK